MTEEIKRIPLTELADELGLKETVLKKKIKELGFTLKRGEKKIEKDLAELIKEELSAEKNEVKEHDTAEIYDEILNKELEREIIKSQRKKTAGKEQKNKEKKEEIIEEKKENKTIEIPEVISVKEFSEKIGLSAAKVIGELMKNGILASLNQQIDYETAAIIASEFKIKIKKLHGTGEIEDLVKGDIEKLLKDDDPENLSSRPPIVSVMGHVDHGKTKLLDYIRKTNVVAEEAGGITQHIGAYQIERNDKKITFLDTPGHEAFTAMRARGAKATDIAILVVAADEGVKPQTIEAINHANEAKIPIIVAVNKIDKETANLDKVKAELSEHGLICEEWGGKTIMLPVSALTGKGIPELLDMILLVAEMQNLKANPARLAIATIIEARLDPNLGPTATVLINTGTLKIGDNIVVGTLYGRVKVMIDHLGKKIKKAIPSSPVKICGLPKVPQAGDILQVFPSEKEAKDKALKILALKSIQSATNRGIGIEEIITQINKGKLKNLKIILKADTKGSLEAIKQSVAQIKDEDVSISVIHGGIGNITEGDIMMAAASKAIVMGFHVKESPRVNVLKEREHVEVIIYTIIYKLIEDISNLIEGLIEPEIITVELGKGVIKKIFMHGKKDMIIGCKILSGLVQNKLEFVLKRGEKEIGKGRILSLKHTSESIDEVKEGQECGLKIETGAELMEGDNIIFLKKEKKMRKINS